MGILRSDVGVALLVTFIFFVLAALLMERTVAISIVAGALTGLFEGTLMFPLENIKIQQQLDGTSVRAAIRRTWAHFGVAGFYRGLTPVLVGAIPTQAIRWGCFEAFCSMSDCRDLSNVGAAAVISGVINSFVTGVPVETWKVSLIHANVAAAMAAAHQRRSPSTTPQPQTLPAVVTIPPEGLEARIVVDTTADADAQPMLASASNSGLPPLGGPLCGSAALLPGGREVNLQQLAEARPMFFYKGWMPTVGKKVINQAIRFPAHSWALRVLCQLFVAADATVMTCRHGHPFLNFVAGAFAGVSSILVTQPIDVAKTRMQGLGAARFRNTIHCLRCIAREEGFGAFMQGAGIRSLRVALGAGLSFALFPWAQSIVLTLWGSAAGEDVGGL